MTGERTERHGSARPGPDAGAGAEELVSEASHALKGPLQTVLGIADLLLEGAYGSLTPGQADAVRRVVEGSQSLDRRLETVVGLVQADAFGSGGRGGEAVPPHLPVGAAVRRISPEASDRGLALSSEVPGDHPALRGPGSYLLRLFETLLRLVLLEVGEGERVVVVRSWPPGDGKARLGVLRGSGGRPGDPPGGGWPPARAVGAPADGRPPARVTLEAYVARRMVEALGGRIRLDPENDATRFGVYVTLPLYGGADA